MRIFIDTNILISASRNPSGTPMSAFQKATTYPNQGVICHQNIEELKRIYHRKFPEHIPALERFLYLALMVLEIVPTPDAPLEDEIMIRDIQDRPLLRAAMNARIDIFITGDKDFLESGIQTPKIMTAVDFVNLS